MIGGKWTSQTQNKRTQSRCEGSWQCTLGWDMHLGRDDLGTHIPCSRFVIVTLDPLTVNPSGECVATM